MGCIGRRRKQGFEQAPGGFLDAQGVAFAAVEEVFVLHIGGQRRGVEVERKNYIVIRFAAAQPGDVELFLADFRGDVFGRQHGDDLAAFVEAFEDFDLPGAAYVEVFPVHENADFRLEPAQGFFEHLAVVGVFARVADENVVLGFGPARGFSGHPAVGGVLRG